MLSRNSALPSAQQPDQYPNPPTPLRRHLRGSSVQITKLDGYVSPREPEKQRIGPSPTPPSRLSQQLELITPQPAFSSLQDYQEYHSGFSDVDIGTPHSSNHRRQHSFPNLLPVSLRSRTPSPARKTTPRIQEIQEQQMPLTGDGRSNGRSDSSKGGFAGWLSSTAAAASALGMSKDNSPASMTANDASSRDITPDTTPTRLRRTPTVVAVSSNTHHDSSTPKSAVATTASRFISALSSKFTPSTPASPMLDEELCNLDIEAALFPAGSPNERDAFSPAAYKNLQTNAVGLLTKMQSAYRERVITIRELQGERSAQMDEIEEAETRAQHLKMQLEGMARKAQEQEKAMQQLMDELLAERKARAEMEQRIHAEKRFSVPVSSEGSMVSEDLAVDEDRRRKQWRKSAGSTVRSSEVGFEGDETDEESAESESVFSRCRSPTIPPNAYFDNGSSIDGPAMHQQPNLPRVYSSTSSLAPPPSASGTVRSTKSSGQMSAFQKIIRGISGDSAEDAGCSNCKGQDASVAWDTVSLLRDENKHLKQRVGELEVAVEGALDLVNGIGL